MSSVKWLLAILKLVGDKVPQVWPHIATIMTEVQAILAMVVTSEGFGEKTPALNKEAKQVLDILDSHGIDQSKSRKGVESMAILDEHL
jgi:hypothetical protein